MSLTTIDDQVVWYCDSCGETDLDPSGEIHFKVALCEHAMNGEDEDEDGSSTTWFDEAKHLHGCGDDQCRRTELCGPCWDDWDYDMPRADGPGLPSPVEVNR